MFKFLAATGRIELPRASWIETSGYLEHRAEMVVRALIRDTEPDRNLTDVDKVWLQTWIHGHADLITRDGNFPFLNAAKREIAQLGHLKIEDVFPQQRFLVIRAKPDHPDAWLTNQLISDFVPRTSSRATSSTSRASTRTMTATATPGDRMLWTF